jgi:hypothetical protein
MQDIDFEAGVWAVVTVTGGRRFIASITGFEDGDEPELEITDWMMERKPLHLEQACELITSNIPAQDPETGRMGFQRLVRCTPVNNCMESAKLIVVPEGLHFFKDMQDGDAEQHKGLVRQLGQLLIEARLKALGITKPPMKGPSGPIAAP